MNSALILIAALVISSAGLSADTRVYVNVVPPPLRREVIAVAPGPGYVWVPGYYSWAGTAYVWAPGRYVLAPHPHAVWVAPHWVHHSRGWYVVPGRWR